MTNWVGRLLGTSCIEDAAPDLRGVGVPERATQYHAAGATLLQSSNMDGFRFTNSAMLKLLNISPMRLHILSLAVLYYCIQFIGHFKVILPYLI
jgi:hypothetical protein